MQIPPFLYRRDLLVQSPKDRIRFQNFRYRRQAIDNNGIGSYTGNGRYEGFIMELLERIRSVIRGIDFEYEVELVSDTKIGGRGRSSYIWNGMIGEVIRGVSMRREWSHNGPNHAIIV